MKQIEVAHRPEDKVRIVAANIWGVVDSVWVERDGTTKFYVEWFSDAGTSEKKWCVAAELKAVGE